MDVQDFYYPSIYFRMSFLAGFEFLYIVERVQFIFEMGNVRVDKSSSRAEIHTSNF